MPFNPIRDLREQASNAMPVRNGRFSPWQLADWLIPGNVYDNQTRQFRPQGIGAGALQMATGFPASATERLSGLFRGNGAIPSGTFDGAMGDISSRAASGVGPVGSVAGRGFVGDGRGNAAVQRGPSDRAPLDAFGGTLGGLGSQGGSQPYQMPGTNTGPRVDAFGNTLDETLAANEAPPAPGGAGGGSGLAGRRSALGAGQLGTGGDMFLSDHMRSIFNRNGTTAER